MPLDFAPNLLPTDAFVPPVVGADPLDAAEAESDEAPFASGGYFIRPRGRARQLPFVAQIDEADCGAAALAMICRHHGRRVSLARIRQLVHTSLDGTSLRGLCSAASELGLAARAVKASCSDLSRMPLPAIAHWQGNHWVVLYDANDRHVWITDPALGRRRLSRKEFDQSWSGYAALFDYTVDFETAPEDHPSLGWIGTLFRPHLATLAGVLALAVAVGVLQMVAPAFTQLIVDGVVVDGDAALLTTLILVMLAVLVFSTLAMVVQRYLLSHVALRVDSASLDWVTRRLLSLPARYFATRRTGDIQRRLDGMRELRAVFVEHGVSGLMALVQAIVAVALMFAYSRLLGTVFLATTPLYVVLMAYSARRLRPIHADLEDASALHRSHQIDAIKGIETVKAMGGELAFRELMLAEFLRVAQKRFRADFSTLLYEGAVGIVSFLSTLLFLWVGATQVMAGRMTIGSFAAFNALLALANQPILVLLHLWDNLQHARVLLDRLNDVLAETPEQGEERDQLVPVPTLEGRVRFENVGFRYGPPGAPQILDGISLEVPAGCTIAIVGRSGSGKTTLAKCLVGLLEPTEGEIYHDGLELRALNHRDLRRQIGFVLQDTYLFSDTIAKNIAFGESEPDVDRVVAAARVANAHDFVMRLPLGYDTKVGESGLALSGGQRQRVAIARAIYLRPPLLVLDEATSSLDVESERAIQQNLDELMKRRTSFVIAHRLSTVRGADLILVLDNGRIVEQGDHASLMQRRGLYHHLVSEQLNL